MSVPLFCPCSLVECFVMSTKALDSPFASFSSSSLLLHALCNGRGTWSLSICAIRSLTLCLSRLLAFFRWPSNLMKCSEDRAASNWHRGVQRISRPRADSVDSEKVDIPTVLALPLFLFHESYFFSSYFYSRHWHSWPYDYIFLSVKNLLDTISNVTDIRDPTV